jgi:uncharacterized repeat protein (TIGR01451 family)
MGFLARPICRYAAPLCCGAALWVSPADAQQANSTVVNIATVEIGSDAGPERVASNPASVRLDEVLDVALAGSPAAAAAPLQVGVAGAVPFTLANRGNGFEAFALTGTLVDVDGTIDGIAIDANGDGRYDPAVDRSLGRDEVSTGRLAPGASLALLLLVSPTRIGANARASVAGRAVTGSGQPGTVFRGRGDGGTDAVVGATTAAATLDLPIAAATADDLLPTLTKSQSVAAPDGSTRPVRGAVITYTLTATFRDAAAVRDAAVSDPIPERTDYVVGSLTLDGVGLSDEADDDAGRFDGSAVRVALGSVSAPATHSIRFQVTIR